MGNGAHAKPGKTRHYTAAAAIIGGAAAPALFAGNAHAATMSQWNAVAQHESGGDWSINHSGDGKSVGGLQFITPTWRATVAWLSSHGYNVSCYNLNPYQGMPRSSVPNKDQTILAGEALLGLYGSGQWASGNGNGLGASMFHGGANPWGLPGTQAPSDATCGSGSPAPAPQPPPTAPPSSPPVVHSTPSSDGENTTPSRGSTVTAPVATGSSYTVVEGDWLAKIAQRHYGDWHKWTLIYAANRDVIGSNPNLIYPGQVLTLP